MSGYGYSPQPFGFNPYKQPMNYNPYFSQQMFGYNPFMQNTYMQPMTQNPYVSQMQQTPQLAPINLNFTGGEPAQPYNIQPFQIKTPEEYQNERDEQAQRDLRLQNQRLQEQMMANSRLPWWART